MTRTKTDAPGLGTEGVVNGQGDDQAQDTPSRRDRFAIVPVIPAVMRLSARQLRVFVAMKSYANGDGRVWPSQEAIARDALLDRRTTRTILRQLEDAGLIRRDGRHVRGHSWTQRWWIGPFHDGGKSAPTQDGGESTPTQDGGESTPTFRVHDGGDLTPHDGGDLTPHDGGESAPRTDQGTDQGTDHKKLQASSTKKGDEPHEPWRSWSPSEPWPPENLRHLRRHLADIDKGVLFERRDAISTECWKQFQNGRPPTRAVVEIAVGDVLQAEERERESVYEREKASRRAEIEAFGEVLEDVVGVWGEP